MTDTKHTVDLYKMTGKIIYILYKILYIWTDIDGIYQNYFFIYLWFI
jgi:hypothetical protein